jgi:fructose-bisphosphate aldolase class II
MKLKTTKQLFDWAKKHNRAICAFNVNNMELIQAVTEAADDMGLPIILQVSKGARSYANPVYLRKLVEAATECTKIPIALHLDHGDSFELCKASIDGGFTSVMIDGSSLPFAENIKLTKKVVDYAKAYAAKHGTAVPSVEGELGELAGIEEHVQNEKSHYTDPATVKEFVTRTGVTSLAVSIGTSHGAFKYKSSAEAANLRLDILAEIQRQIPNVPLVLHGASSVTESDVKTINAFGGRLDNALGAPEEALAKCIPLGVRKINIDSDLRLAFTAKTREYFSKNPAHFDPRQYLGAARAHVKELVKKKLTYFTK